MIGKKIAFLLDFDGPLFDNDAVKSAIMRDFGLSESMWSEIYNSAKQGSSYVDYGKIITDISLYLHLSEKDIWLYLLSETKNVHYCSNETKDALLDLAALGRIELITQGHTDYQGIKVEASGVRSILNQSKINSISIVPKEKTKFLTRRLITLKKKGYTVVQIDDRVGPLYRVNQFAAENGLSDDFYQIRIRTGKHSRENAQTDVFSINSFPWTEFSSLSEARFFLKKQLTPIRSHEGAMYPAAMKK